MKRIIFGLCLTLASLQAGVAQHAETAIKQLVYSGKSTGSLWAVSVRDSTGKELVSVNSDALITPASNLKLVSSAAFLRYLGADFRFKTQVYGIGMLEDSTWNGDIYIVGSGDPSIGGDLYNDNKWFAFDSILDQLKKFGINRVKGQMIGDESLFDDVPYPGGWSWDDLSFYYATELSPLSFNNNTVDLVVQAKGKSGDRPEIEWFPFNTDYVQFINEQQITGPKTEYKEYYRRVLGTNTIILRSTMPIGYVEEEALSITQPGLYFLDTFIKYAEQRGFSIESGYQVNRVPTDYSEGFIKLAVHESKPLSEFIKQINKKSDNFYTEMLNKAMVVEEIGTQGSTETGIRLIKDFLAEMRVDTSMVEIDDASGMAPTNLIAAKDLSYLLVQYSKQKWFQVFDESLSLAAFDGTLKNRFKNTGLSGNFKGKTGYIGGARTLSGYFRTDKGKLLFVTVATNHFTDKVSVIDAKHQQILEWLYERM
ncbi:D-alanyl-D-alanine carboxypeptidase/D-alanyl-D-alanine-endopeptidase [bacterium]|nr:MAG: D-alanyl-D-alanine carboxypeptidase/D-alanyl-D-alanine-endopeptidase [bacterium]